MKRFLLKKLEDMKKAWFALLCKLDIHKWRDPTEEEARDDVECVCVRCGREFSYWELR